MVLDSYINFDFLSNLSNGAVSGSPTWDSLTYIDDLYKGPTRIHSLVVLFVILYSIVIVLYGLLGIPTSVLYAK